MSYEAITTNITIILCFVLSISITISIYFNYKMFASNCVVAPLHLTCS